MHVTATRGRTCAVINSAARRRGLNSSATPTSDTSIGNSTNAKSKRGLAWLAVCFGSGVRSFDPSQSHPDSQQHLTPYAALAGQSFPLALHNIPIAAANG